MINSTRGFYILIAILIGLQICNNRLPLTKAITLVHAMPAPQSSQIKTNIFATSKWVDLNSENSGKWTVSEDGQSVNWTLSIQEEASSLNFGFSEFVLPPSARFTICDDTGKRCQEFLPKKDLQHHLQLWTPILKGDKAELKLTLLKAEKSLLRLRLNSINMGMAKEVDRAASQECLIDVVCAEQFPQIEDFEAEVQSVALITIEGTRICTGVLLNNVREDFTPYFLTARHCGITAENAPSVVVHWNYENPECRFGLESNKVEGEGSLEQFNSGAEFLSDLQRSDFTLLRLNDPVIEEARAYFAGWDARSPSPVNVTTVHHANTEEKRITFATGETSITRHFGEEEDPELNHIRIPQWETSSTAGGSSGGPLFDDKHRVVGQLHGGLAACGNDEPDWFGRFHTSWLGDSVPQRQLKHWLDPDDTGIEFVDGLWDGLNPLALQIGATQVDMIACNGDQTGSIVIDVFNGAGPFEYSIDGGESFQEQALFQNLAAGEYVLMVRDINQLTSSEISFEVTEPDELTLEFGQEYNQIVLSVDGGKEPYLISNNGQISFDSIYNNLPIGINNFTVTDANGCVQNLEIDLQYDAFQAIAEISKPISCFDAVDGRISIVHSGTVGPYQYSLNNTSPSSINVFENLGPGNYIGTVVDKLGNTVSTQNLTLEAPEELSIDLDPIEENIFVNVNGGVAPYLYQYDNGEPSMTNFFRSAEQVSIITIIDANGCSVEFLNTLTSSREINADIAIDLYPNPATSRTLFIDTDNEILTQYYIHDLMGRMVQNGDQLSSINGIHKINIEELLQGTYILEVFVQSGKRKVLKFIVLR